MAGEPIIGLDYTEFTVDESTGVFQMCASFIEIYEGPPVAIDFVTENISATSELWTGLQVLHFVADLYTL